MQQARGSRCRLIQTGETAEAKFAEVGRRREAIRQLNGGVEMEEEEGKSDQYSYGEHR